MFKDRLVNGPPHGHCAAESHSAGSSRRIASAATAAAMCTHGTGDTTRSNAQCKVLGQMIAPLRRVPGAKPIGTSARPRRPNHLRQWRRGRPRVAARARDFRIGLSDCTPFGFMAQGSMQSAAPSAVPATIPICGRWFDRSSVMIIGLFQSRCICETGFEPGTLGSADSASRYLI